VLGVSLTGSPGRRGRQAIAQSAAVGRNQKGTTDSAAIDLPPTQAAEPMDLSTFRQGVGAKEARNI
jgi:hypothetical protein